MRVRDDPQRRPMAACLWERVRSVSAWSVLVAAVAFAFVFGLRLWVVVVGVFGLVWAGVSRALSDRVAERFERQPQLMLQVAVGDGQWGSPPPPRQPWPVDAAAIVEALHAVVLWRPSCRRYARTAPSGLLA